MYLNIKLIHELGFDAIDILQMQLLKQNRNEDLTEILPEYFEEEVIEKLSTQGILVKVKKKKKSDSDMSIIRLSKKGQDILDKVCTPKVEERDYQMLEYLTEMYLSHEDSERKVGNKKKVVQYISIFRNHMGFSIHQTYWLLWRFLQDFSYTKVLEYLFFNSNKNRYGTFEANIEDSPIYQYYEENKESIEQLWKNKIK
ncbi:hypothetical protein Phi4:1_gp196 [Cellulophaga phage phi4:1]|uniref:Uncharacterized protein n=5 Tax=Lightbulbvirus TaxID=1918522 RepID=A0A0S2MX04_9CAUD|nr:hypothetical protein Phi4:1_gp196 [Cellulophaga phage phi4:1]YP_008241692.1 hypothetical protein Phi17:2_gp197 [Cellulophaga phage phi17:2]ALO80205.1 hypothetical protein Phi4113_196 [Cellulophaga phage phi4:1_13]ALO80402.1 hypothetical protein Phi4118_196 [Cellulophaga phage phi4:1_18]ALO80600.1 hypothetical protein Phi17218_197 [Cellulophaga phage phi17:2_18]AGO47730.1 hypothetical protein Phi17:2_gp197 [Cellulophaga phage phi17:2]AGO49609.1 hypothetical protein Phi4:1_gp196 [Cellulophag